LEETYEAEGGQVSHRRQQLRLVQRDAHLLEARLEYGTRQLRLLLNEKLYLQREEKHDERRIARITRPTCATIAILTHSIVAERRRYVKRGKV